MARIVKFSFPNTTFFGVDIAEMLGQNCKRFLAAKETSSKGSTRKNPLQNPPLVSFHRFIRHFSPGIMKVKRLDFDLGVEGVLVEEHRAPSVVAHVEPICQNIMIDIPNSFL